MKVKSRKNKRRLRENLIKRRSICYLAVWAPFFIGTTILLKLLTLNRKNPFDAIDGRSGHNYA